MKLAGLILIALGTGWIVLNSEGPIDPNKKQLQQAITQGAVINFIGTFLIAVSFT